MSPAAIWKTARFPFLEIIIGDSAYAGDRVRDAAPRRVEIIRRSDTAKGFQVQPKRWIVERTSAWINANRRMARDFEHHAETANADFQIAMIKLMSRRLARSVNAGTDSYQGHSTDQALRGV